MASLVSLKNSQKNVMKKRNNITDHELMLYQQQKRIKDYQFYSSIIPYVSSFCVGLTISIFIFLHINQRYSKRGISLLDRLKFNLLDIKEVKK